VIKKNKKKRLIKNTSAAAPPEPTFVWDWSESLGDFDRACPCAMSVTMSQ